MSRKDRAYERAAVYIVLFVVLTVLVRCVDVRGIGADGSNVGLSHLNGFFFFITRSHPILYVLTQLLAYAAAVVAASFVIIAVGLKFRRRTIRPDRGILCLIPTYALMFPFYYVFRVFTVNNAPALLAEQNHPVASYPSIATMICCTVFGTAMIEWHRLFQDQKELLEKLETAGLVIIVLSVVLRLLSGLSWFTDILAAILISLFLTNFYQAISLPDTPRRTGQSARP